MSLLVSSDSLTGNRVLSSKNDRVFTFRLARLSIHFVTWLSDAFNLAPCFVGCIFGFLPDDPSDLLMHSDYKGNIHCVSR